MWARLGRPSQLVRQCRATRPRKPYSSSSDQPPKGPSITKSTETSAPEASNPRFERMHSRMPKFLRPYTEGLRNAPVSHITSFLILHELTAVVPLIGFGVYFYRTDELPWYAEGKWFNDGVAKFGNYFRKKGWLGDDTKLGEDGQTIEASKRWKWWGRGENGVKLVTSAAAAYALTKLLLPARLVFSIWLTPLFARKTLVPITRSLKGLFKRKKP